MEVGVVIGRLQHPDEYVEHESTETHRYYVQLPHGGKVYVGQTHDGACP